MAKASTFLANLSKDVLKSNSSFTSYLPPLFGELVDLDLGSK